MGGLFSIAFLFECSLIRSTISILLLLTVKPGELAQEEVEMSARGIGCTGTGTIWQKSTTSVWGVDLLDSSVAPLQLVLEYPGNQCLAPQAEVHGQEGALFEVPQGPCCLPAHPAWDQASDRQEVPGDPHSPQGQHQVS